MNSASRRGSKVSRNARVLATRPRPTSLAVIFRSSSQVLASGSARVSVSRLCSSTTSTPRSRILVMKSKWSRRAFCTHITSSNSRSSQFVGVSRSWASPGAQTSTLRSCPTSEYTPYRAAGEEVVSVMGPLLDGDGAGGQGGDPDDEASDGDDEEHGVEGGQACHESSLVRLCGAVS